MSTKTIKTNTREVRGRVFNPLDSKGNYSATSNNTKLVRWPLMGGLLHLVQRGKAWAGCGPPSPLFAVPHVTAHRSTVSVPITVLLHDGPLLCGFNVAIKGLTINLCTFAFYTILHWSSSGGGLRRDAATAPQRLPHLLSALSISMTTSVDSAIVGGLLCANISQSTARKRSSCTRH